MPVIALKGPSAFFTSRPLLPSPERAIEPRAGAVRVEWFPPGGPREALKVVGVLPPPPSPDWLDD